MYCIKTKEKKYHTLKIRHRKLLQVNTVYLRINNNNCYIVSNQMN